MCTNVCAFLMAAFAFPSCGMEISVNQKNDFQQENIQWEYIKEEPLKKIYLPWNSIVNIATLHNQFIVYIIPNITKDELLARYHYNFTICKSLFEMFDIDFELYRDCLIKLRVSEKLDVSLESEGGMGIIKLQDDFTANYYKKILDHDFRVSYSYVNKNFNLRMEGWKPEGYLVEIRNTSPALDPEFCYPSLSPRIEDHPIQTVINNGERKRYRRSRCIIF